MLTLRPSTFDVALPLSTVWLLADCMEFRGRQGLWTHHRPELLAALRQRAMAQSVESSNRIEGVTVSEDRLAPLVLDHDPPRDRSEQELAGYREALEWIRGTDTAELSPRVIRHLHALAQAGAGDAGQFKQRDNEIVQVMPGGERRIPFRPTPATDTPAAIQAMCDAYTSLSHANTAPPLLLAITAVFDFLCIHPFRDGNGRVSRLLTTFLLGRLGFAVDRYVSLERLIEESKDDYYRVLAECSARWHEGTNPILPWWNYQLGILRRAYVDFARLVETDEPRPGKRELVRRAILARVGAFTLASLRAELPGISAASIKQTLLELRTAGRVKLIGRGAGARWTVIE
mgnify:CR=1 FL=1